ncbi:hypothetical protein, partial [Blautia wexlerae]|uniref:hypothetical protein n=1 Tax=Blautia wexlerae TaxID=418240 RepID=UPI00139B5140|nr:tape measure domain-containing protein [Blautia wexlerae]
NQNVNTAAYMVNAGVLKAGTVLYGLIAGQISLMSVAQIAGSATTGLWSTAVTLFNAAWAANPIGLVIVAMAGLIAAGTALWNWLNRDSEETKKLKAEQENLVAQTDELTKSVNEHAKARRDAVQENSSSSKSYKALADEIVKLSQVENKTAGEKKNLQKKIEILNGAVDSLNLAYDKNTNSLSHNTQQLYDRIDAMEAESQWATAQESLLAIEQERVDLSKQLTEVSKQRNEVTTAQNITDGERQKLLGELAGKESELKIALENNRLEYTSTAEAQSAAAEVMAAAAEAGSNRQVIAYENMSEAQKTAVDNMRQRFQELLDTTTNMFGQIEQKTAISVEQINANLEANRVATEQWATNLQVLAERGVDQGILEQLRQMGPEGAAQTQVFVNATDAELAVLQENFRRNGEAAKTALNSELSSAGQEIPEGVRNLVTNVSSGLQAELAAADFASLGKEIPNGVGQGITAGTQQSSEAARKMSEITKKAFQQDMGINSPSRVFTEYGGHITTGLANGIANNSSTPVGRVADLANNMKTPFLGFQNYFVSIGSMAMQGLAAGISLGSGSALSAAAIVAGQVKSTIQKALDIH